MAKRFIIKEEDSLRAFDMAYKIIVDTQTGVNYIVIPNIGITPIIDENGKPLVNCN